MGAIAVATPIVMLIALYYRITGFERSIPFAGLALRWPRCSPSRPRAGQAPTAPGHRRRRRDLRHRRRRGARARADLRARKGWLTVALALMVPGIAWIADQRPLPMLRKLCGVIVVLVMARIAWDPRIVGGDVGTTPIFNWLL